MFEPDALDESRLDTAFLTIFEVITILLRVMSVLRLKLGSSWPELSRLQFLEKSSAKSLTFSEAEVKTSRPLDKGGTADFPLFKTLLAICQKSQEPTF